MDRPQAILLLGPTGSGKTPLGEMIARRGLWGRRARHFDFGWQLRQAADGADAARLSPEEIEFLRQVLQRGLLLEDEHFDIAARILRAFLEADASSQPAWVVLNGMPRHVGQARAVEPIIRVSAVIELDCSAEVVRQRIASNVGGDRAGREDDAMPAIERRLATYGDRTRPLVEHYRRLGRRVETVTVAADSTADDVYAEIERRNALC